MSCRAARVAAPEGTSWWSCGGSKARSASATQPTLRQWSRTLMPGRPSSVVFAQQSSWCRRSSVAGACRTLFLGAGTLPECYQNFRSSGEINSPLPERHVYFTGDTDPYERLKRALRAEIDEAAWHLGMVLSRRVFDVFLLDFTILGVLVTIYDYASGMHLIFHTSTVVRRPEQQRPFWKAEVGTLCLAGRRKRIG